MTVPTVFLLLYVIDDLFPVSCLVVIIVRFGVEKSLVFPRI